MNKTFLQMAEKHANSDMLRQGAWWRSDHKKGCSVGCFNYELGNKPSDYAALSKFTGYPEWSHRFQEAVFEFTYPDESKAWHVNFARKAEQIKNWDEAYHQIMVKILETMMGEYVDDIVESIIDFHKNWKVKSSDEWENLRSNMIDMSFRDYSIDCFFVRSIADSALKDPHPYTVADTARIRPTFENSVQKQQKRWSTISQGFLNIQ